MPTWLSVLAASLILAAAAFQGWALWRMYRKQGGRTLLLGAALMWLLGLGMSGLIFLGEFGLLP